MIQKLKENFNKKTSISSIVFFRIIFGIYLISTIYKFFTERMIERYFIEPEFGFKYAGFRWISQPSEGNTYLIFAILGIAAVFITIGLYYRISSTVFFMGFGYFFLMDKVNYNHEFYWTLSFLFLMIWIPANRNLSVDSVINPSIRSLKMSKKHIYLLKFQLAIPLIYTAIHCISTEWLSAQYIQYRFEHNLTSYHLSNEMLEWLPKTIACIGLVYGLLMIPSLANRKTQKTSFILLIIYYIIAKTIVGNATPLNWFIVLSTTLFFDENWFFDKLKNIDFYRKYISIDQPYHNNTESTLYKINNHKAVPYLYILFFVIYSGIQVIIPLKVYAYQGNPGWTNEGTYFSWYPKFQERKIKNHAFTIKENNRKKSVKFNPEKQLLTLTRRQRIKVIGNPELLALYAKYIKLSVELNSHYRNVSVHLYSLIRYNNMDALESYTDPTADISSSKAGFLENQPFIVLHKDK